MKLRYMDYHEDIRIWLGNEDLQNFPQVEREFKVIDTDTRIVVVDPSVAERLQYGKVDWSELQKVSVQIAKI